MDWFLTLSHKLKCSGVITAHCSLELLGLSDPTASAFQVAKTSSVHNHAWLIKNLKKFFFGDGVLQFPKLVLNSSPQTVLLHQPRKVLELQV